MGGLSGLVKVVVALLVIFAAATGTEVVDVVELADAATERAQNYFNDVELEGDETDFFDESVELGPEFARPTEKSPADALAFRELDDADDTADAEQDPASS